eukprot:scaffold2825_cov111-Isochrysis_galbana.AAC.6
MARPTRSEHAPCGGDAASPRSSHLNLLRLVVLGILDAAGRRARGVDAHGGGGPLGVDPLGGEGDDVREDGVEELAQLDGA